MKQNDLMGGLIAITILSFMLILSLNTFFMKTAITAKLLAVASFILLLFLIIPGWLQILKTIKQEQ